MYKPEHLQKLLTPIIQTKQWLTPFFSRLFNFDFDTTRNLLIMLLGYIASDMIPERVFRNSPPFLLFKCHRRSINCFFSDSPFVIVKEDFVSFFSVRLFSILTSCGKVICRWQLERGKVRMVERGRKGCSHKTARNIAHASHNRLCNWGGDGIKIEIERYYFFGALGRVWLVTSHGALYYFPLYFGCRLFYCKQK